MEELRNLIETNYNLKVNDIEKIKNAYRIETDDGFKCFKASRYDFRQFEFIIGAISHLLNRGFENVISINSTWEGKKYINLPNGFGFLCDWIDSREASFDNPVELMMCIDTLSRLHLESRGYEPDLTPGNRNQYGKWIKRFKKRCDELMYFKALISEKDRPTEFDTIFSRYFDNHYKQGLKTVRDLEGSKYSEIMEMHKKTAEFCHHDTANHNFLITPELKMYMIDFDYCILDTHLHDITSLIIRNMKYGNWNMDILEYILGLYSKNIPVNKDELYVMFCFMEFPQDFWQVGLQYYVEKQPWDEEFFMKKLNRTVMDSRERIEFLREFEAMLLEGYHV